MKCFKKPLAVVLAFALIVTAFSAVPTLFAVQASAEEEAAVNNVTLDVGNGKIVLYTDHYTQNGVEYGGFSCENTVYTITGIINRTDSALCVYQVAEDAPAVTFNVVFKDLAILGEQWCSVVHFTTAQIAGEGEPAPMTVNLRLEGRNYLGGHSHPGLSGNATVNLTAAPGSYSVFTAEYSDTPEAFASELTLNKVGTYDVKVAGEAAELDAGKSAKPVVIIGQDPAEVVSATSDAPDAAETADEQTPRSAKNLIALWVVLAFVGGAACAVAVVATLYKMKKKPATEQTDADAEQSPAGEDRDDRDTL